MAQEALNGIFRAFDGVNSIFPAGSGQFNFRFNDNNGDAIRFLDSIKPFPGHIHVEGDPSDGIVFRYQPLSRKRSKGAKYKYIDVPGMSDPIMQFISGGIDKISFELLLDDRDGRRCDMSETSAIEADVQWLRSKIVPERRQNELLSSPPVLLFILGNESERVRLENVSDDVQLFNFDGTAKRIKVALTMSRTINRSRNPIDLLTKF